MNQSWTLPIDIHTHLGWLCGLYFCVLLQIGCACWPWKGLYEREDVLKCAKQGRTIKVSSVVANIRGKKTFCNAYGNSSPV